MVDADAVVGVANKSARNATGNVRANASLFTGNLLPSGGRLPSFIRLSRSFGVRRLARQYPTSDLPKQAGTTLESDPRGPRSVRPSTRTRRSPADSRSRWGRDLSDARRGGCRLGRPVRPGARGDRAVEPG